MGPVFSSKAPEQMNQTTLPNIEEIGVDYETPSPRFSVQNMEEIQQGVEYLDEHGYAVFSNVLSNDQIDHSVDLLWKHFENLKAPFRIRRDCPQTWNKPW
jgi:hypothetical protein